MSGGGGGGVHVAILMATRNGAAFLSEQLESIAAQDHRNWSLTVSDDGSSDATRDIVAAFAARHPGYRVALRDGPGSGSTANFLSLIAAAGGRAGLIALSDQDDIWLPDKLSRAAAVLSPFASQPALYGARTILADRAGRATGLSPLFRRPPSFGNALVQSIAGGNTMVLNAGAAALAGELAGAALAPGGRLPACHDWWLYQLVTGAGGTVIYDPRPALLYRQHDGNQIGANRSARARARRLSLLLQGRFARWNDLNLAALEAARPFLTEAARERIGDFRRLRHRRGPAALAALARAGLVRQTAAGTLSLAVGAALGKL
ncbi:MAG: glycosyltransferase family 2 protein [Paracoccaceae bacterium]